MNKMFLTSPAPEIASSLLLLAMTLCNTPRVVIASEGSEAISHFLRGSA